jgi:biopolymer transport protein ExbB/TolQ
MSAILDLAGQGGPVMVALILLSILLYQRCLDLLLFLVQIRRQADGELLVGPRDLPRFRRQGDDLRAVYQRDRGIIGSLIATAPLLGLLGTVMGMVGTFESLAVRSSQQSIEGLAGGISMALITTETGLAIAIPALIILYYAQRKYQEAVLRLNQLESRIMEAM